MNKLINIIDTTSNTLTTIKNKIDLKLQQQKQKLAIDYFQKNEYLQNYIQHFYDDFNASFINELGFLCRFNDFDFTQIPDTLKEQLKEYMSDYHCLHYHSDDYCTGFTADSFENIYLSYEQDIYADFMKKSLHYNTDLELFLKLEQIQSEHGIYPDIVYLDYYDNYYEDYKMPEKYAFLRTAQHTKEDRLIHFINNLVNLYDTDYTGSYYYNDNFIIEQFTPEVIKKINNNLSIDINEVSLDDDFTLHIEFEIPTVLKESDLEKLNIINYHYTKYNTTVIDINVNIENWLKEELAKGYSFSDLKEAA